MLSIKMTNEIFFGQVFTFILIAIFLTLKKANVKFRSSLCSLVTMRLLHHFVLRHNTTTLTC